MPVAAEPVSYPEEPLILVDADDRVVGSCAKAECHAGEGLLHRAFSIFLFNPGGQLLIHQRSAEKPLWPLFWTNSCCSHPRWGETLAQATERRLGEELGLASELTFLYRFQYHARYLDLGSERELCSVFAGRVTTVPAVNPAEVADWRYLAPEEMDRELALHPDRYTPWCQMEWRQLRSQLWPRIEELR